MFARHYEGSAAISRRAKKEIASQARDDELTANRGTLCPSGIASQARDDENYEFGKQLVRHCERSAAISRRANEEIAAQARDDELTTNKEIASQARDDELTANREIASQARDDEPTTNKETLCPLGIASQARDDKLTAIGGMSDAVDHSL